MEIKSKLAAGGTGRSTSLADSDLSDELNIAELYLAAFSREPRSTELATAIEYLRDPQTDVDGNPVDEKTLKTQNYQDLIWALMNSKEFLFNH